MHTFNKMRIYTGPKNFPHALDNLVSYTHEYYNSVKYNYTNVIVTILAKTYLTTSLIEYHITNCYARRTHVDTESSRYNNNTHGCFLIITIYTKIQ